MSEAHISNMQSMCRSALARGLPLLRSLHSGTASRLCGSRGSSAPGLRRLLSSRDHLHRWAPTPHRGCHATSAALDVPPAPSSTPSGGAGSVPNPAAPTFQDAISRLQQYWASVGCALWLPHNTEVGAGTMNPATFLRVLGPEPWNVAYAEPSVRPDDSRYGDNPNRVQRHTQFQVRRSGLFFLFFCYLEREWAIVMHTMCFSCAPDIGGPLRAV